MPDISFVIPTYNAAFHLECCLKSIRNQAYPQDRIEIVVVDGGSTDNTLAFARQYNCRIFPNPKRLAEYGLQIGVQNSSGNFLVPFAADNELVGNNWVKKVLDVFFYHRDVCAVWGRLASAKNDSALNKYFELIQSDPLSWFLNKNLNKYIARAQKEDNYFLFAVDPAKPLVWGANGLVYRSEKVKHIWWQEGYLGDNDTFQYMIEQGNNKVAYFASPFVYHHHVANLREWIKKWKRNYKLHFLDKLETRNLGWVFTSNFNLRLLYWLCYSLCPIFSVAHSIYLALRDRNIYWLYHPLVSYLQTFVYAYITLTTKEGRSLFKDRLKTAFR